MQRSESSAAVVNEESKGTGGNDFISP